MRTLRRSLAFDWLYDYPGFDAALKDKLAADLLDGAAKMMALQSLADPAQASYHNHTARELALAVFALTAIEGHASVEAEATPLREKAHRALDNILETTDARGSRRLVPRVDGLHAHHLGAPGAHGRAAPHHDRRGSRPPLRHVPEHGADLPLQGPARRLDRARRRQRVPAPERARQRGPRLRRPSLQGPVRGVDPEEERLASGRVGHPDPASSCGATPRSSRAIPRPPPRPSCRAAACSPGSGISSCAAAGARTRPGSSSRAGPYFAKHDHLDTNQFTIYHKGYLAIDAGADYTDTESPHYLNHYRRTIAHNTHARVRAGRALLLEREPVARGERRRPAHGLVALLELGAQPRGLRADPRPVGSRPDRGLRRPAGRSTSTCAAMVRGPTSPRRWSASCASCSGSRNRTCCSSSTA